MKLINEQVEYVKLFEDEGGYWYKGSGIVTGGLGGTLNARPNLGYTIYFNKKTKDKIAVCDYDIQLAKSSNDMKKIYKDDIHLIKKGYAPIRPPKKGNLLGCWTWSLEKFNNEKHCINISKTKSGYSIFQKKYVSKEDLIIKENKLFYKKIKKLPGKSVIKYSTSQGTRKIVDMFGKKVFNNPKNIEMVKYLISLYPNKNAIILDFFAGSGTTGHAVLELNKEDGGNRQFILCTNNENNICEEITYQRLNKVIHGYTTPKGKEVEGISGNLKYYKTDFVPKNLNANDI